MIATELHVGTSQLYETISDAYDAAQNGDEIIIHPGNYYDHLDVELDIDITGSTLDPNDVIIESDHSGYSPFLIDQATCNISNLTVCNSGNGISMFVATLTIENCIVAYNDYAGITCSNYSDVTVLDCIIKGNGGYGIFLDEPFPDRNGTIENTLVIGNGFDFDGAGIYMAEGTVSNCTIVENKKGIIRLPEESPVIINSIVYNNQLGQVGSYITNVTYSNIQGGFTGTGNINADPLFANPSGGDYQLTQLSPCIDTGDPTLPLDPDNTVADMGCYYFHHEYDIKRFEEGIQWVSFPYLTQQGTSGSEIFEQAYFENGYSGLLQETSGTFGTINGFLSILGYRNGDISIVPVGNVFDIYDEGFGNMLFRHEGYKIEVAVGAEPTVLIVDGNRLGAYTLDMLDLEKYWLGYYIPYPQNIEVAFGDFWGDVNRVWAEDWYYDAHLIQRGGDPTQLSSNSTKGKTMEYGKMYIVDMYRDVDNFSWYGSTTAEEPVKKAPPENFNYAEKMDYEVIDVVSIPSNVTEIGVFEDEVCVGAITVEDSSEQILVYSDNANREPIPFTFEIVTGRGFSNPTKDYLVLNQMTGEFEPSVIISGQQGYSAIKFGEQAESENIIAKPMLIGNYPNPFNPTTTISFSLPTEQNIELTIYNIKGQKVKTLYSGTADVGEHNVIWEGKDTNDKDVSSGIYFYKLTTNNKELTRKMLIMK